MIDAKTKLVALIGRPVGHSLSPKMQNVAFEKAGLNFAYVALEVEPGNVGAAVAGMRALGFAGANVTIPHKSAVIRHLDEIDPVAEKIGAVNTIVNKKGVLKGHNTDANGAAEALEKRTKLKGKRVLIIGAGGAARAISFALRGRGAYISIADVEHEKAESLAKSVGAGTRAMRLDALKSADAEILINASPVGMHPATGKMPVSESILNKNMLVFDIVYNPVRTLLLKKAEGLGCKTIPGLEMLLNQGAAAFELWTGKKAPKGVMGKALREGLGIK